ncbi:MAG: EamA family transporter [Candidatus Bathyarchaeia archaeon]
MECTCVGILLGYISTSILYCFTTKFIGRHPFNLLWKPSIGIVAGHLLSFYAPTYTNVSIVTSLQQTQPLFVILLARRYLAKLEVIDLKLILGSIAILCGVILVSTV